nr:hypothetical protein [Victivallales bacterium]
HLWDMPPIVEEYLTTRNEEIAEKAWELTRAINPRPYSGNLACLAALYAANFPEYLEKHLAAALVADYALRFALLAGADINPLTKKFLELVG